MIKGERMRLAFKDVHDFVTNLLLNIWYENTFTLVARCSEAHHSNGIYCWPSFLFCCFKMASTASKDLIVCSALTLHQTLVNFTMSI